MTARPNFSYPLPTLRRRLPSQPDPDTTVDATRVPVRPASWRAVPIDGLAAHGPSRAGSTMRNPTERMLARPARRVRFADLPEPQAHTLTQRMRRHWYASVGPDVLIDQVTIAAFGVFWWSLFESHGTTRIFANRSVVGQCFIGMEIVVGLIAIAQMSDDMRSALTKRRQALGVELPDSSTQTEAMDTSAAHVEPAS